MNKNKKNPIVFAIFAIFFAIIFVSSVVRSFVSDGINSESSFIFLPFVIIAITFGIIVFSIIQATKQNVIINQINFQGTETTGTYVDAVSVSSSNTVSLFKIKFSWVDELNTSHTTESLKNYNIVELNYFKEKQTFKIKYLGDKAIIAEEVTYTSSVPTSKSIPEQPKQRYCEYCGSMLFEGDKKCLNCGASIKNKGK